MTHWVTSNGIRIDRLLSGRSNAFLLTNGGRHLLIDTGRKSGWSLLQKRLSALCVTKETLTALVLTHTHFDHAENASRIQEVYQPKLIVHASEAACLRSGDNPSICGTNPASRLLLWMFGGALHSFLRYHPAKEDIRVDETFDLSAPGFSAYLLHTPGHTIGSISIVVDREIAIVGDALFGMFPNSVFPPFADQTEELIKSWKKLLDTGCALFLPAHGKPVTRDLLQKEYDAYRTRFKLSSV